MTKTILKYLLILPFLLSINLKAQDPIFYLFNGSPVYNNPAFTGLATTNNTNKARFTFNYNGGFSGINDPMRVMNLSWDQQINNIGGVGAHIFRDGNSFLTHTRVGASYSAQANLTEKILLSGGVQLGFDMKSVDPNLLKWGDQIVPTQGFDTSSSSAPLKTNLSYFTLNSGLLLSTDKWMAGLSIFNINEPNTSFNPPSVYKVQPRMLAMLGYRFNINASISVTPTVQIHVQQPVQTFLVGGMANIKNFQLSAQYQAYKQNLTNYDRLQLGAGYTFKAVRLMYNIGFQIENTASIGNQHELGLRWLWNTKAKKEIHKDILSAF